MRGASLSEAHCCCWHYALLYAVLPWRCMPQQAARIPEPEAACLYSVCPGWLHSQSALQQSDGLLILMVLLLQQAKLCQA